MKNYSIELNDWVENIGALIGIDRQIPERTIDWECNWGGDRMNVHIDASIVKYLAGIKDRFDKKNEIFNDMVMERWHLVNMLSIQKYITGGGLGAYVKIEHSSALACLAAFPLYEDVLSRFTGMWGDDGAVFEEIGTDFKLVDEKGSLRTYKKGKTISSLYQKSQIAVSMFRPKVKALWDDFDKASRRPTMKGLPESLPILIRLFNRRNYWSHGGEFEGNEGVIVSLILAFFYINSAYIGVKLE